MNDHSETSGASIDPPTTKSTPDPLPKQHTPEYRSPLGKTDVEDEAGHLRRVADELGGANSGSIEILRSRLASEDPRTRRSAASALGAIGDRHAIATLRALLEQGDPSGWEIAVHGLRQSRDRAGWMCLESVALDHVGTLEEAADEPVHAFRLLVMGRTKTMDRLFRAIDGHSRSLSPVVALAFARVAVCSVPEQMSTVIALRLGLSGGSPSTPEQASVAASLPVETVRRLEGLAWETVQRARPYPEIRQHYEVNRDRFRSTD